MKITMNASIKLFCAASELKGTVRAAVSVDEDLRAVFGNSGGVWTIHSLSEIQADCILFGTIQTSEILSALEKSGLLSLDEIRGKREVYKMCVVSLPTENMASALVIAGSDKRGTIYGLYKFSEMCGISPLRKWSGCEPKKQSSIVLDLPAVMTSREPSVRYRGIFINDEWPAFGNWATLHFGDVNAKCYEGIFELTLRLKGNYFWPAMWASCFNLDGPGLASAQLADRS